MTSPERLVLIGHPVSHSLSPVMYDAALVAAGREARYEALDVVPDNLEQTLSELTRKNCAGNFTIPHKKAALRLMSECSDLARHAGAVNTFRPNDAGGFTGDNTDVAGFNAMVLEALGEIPAGARVAVLGAGGAATAVLTALGTWSGASASVHARDLARATSMRMRHSIVTRACSMRDPCLTDADIVVNATPIGLNESDEHPAELERLKQGAVVFDLVYGRDETAWVREAHARGHRAFDGLSMLLHQGVAAYEFWFGEPPDRVVMWAALLGATGRV